jgi:hypothetical protein
MSSRLIPVLLLAAVVFACGPRAHNEAATPTKDSASTVAQAGNLANTSLAAATPRVAEQKTPKAKIEGQLYVHVGESSVRLALHVVNTTKKRVELTFPSGQIYDFTILDSLGNEVWRWGKGRMFTQTLRNKLLAAGDAMDLEETWKSPLPAGRYTARASLTSLNFPIVEQYEFRIDPTTIASR